MNHTITLDTRKKADGLPLNVPWGPVPVDAPLVVDYDQVDDATLFAIEHCPQVAIDGVDYEARMGLAPMRPQSGGDPTQTMLPVGSYTSIASMVPRTPARAPTVDNRPVK
jgi:hypothetical protein